ncbi:hypothetical protein [Bacteroides ilei]|uniref:hypothetical protein n=1 Tax=Bacteroides ilei TaxID=1907658 RepID=UPI000930B33D|nr:hypothetical protein [Bacteroides ilei]
MKSRIFVSLLVACLPWLAMAQSNDDIYFIPKKEKKVEQQERTVGLQEKVGVVPKEVSRAVVHETPGATVVVKDVSGKVRDVDEYNRRYSSRDYSFSYQSDSLSADGTSLGNDTLFISEKPYSERGEWVNGFNGTQNDYEYAMRIVRFRSPRYAIPVSSPLYWDVVYGAFPSWDWNVYDDGLYAYIFPTSTNPLWWDWRWNWSLAGPGFGWGWYSPWYYNSWYSPWYSSWYSPYWYGGFYAGYWGGYWGLGWHHPYPGWGWGGGWVPRGHTDFRPSRYENYASSRRQGGVTGRTVTGRQTNPLNSSRRNSSIGRVVRPSSVGNTGTSVRPAAGSSSLRGSSSRVGAIRGGNSTYVRPSSTVNRSGSSYNRPSSTRRSFNYGESNTRSTNQFNSSRSSNRSSFSRGMGSSTRSSGGGFRSGGGGSSRRR